VNVTLHNDSSSKINITAPVPTSTKAKLACASPISGIGRRILWEFDLKLEQSKYKHRMTPGQRFELETKSLDILAQLGLREKSPEEIEQEKEREAILRLHYETNRERKRISKKEEDKK
jgi:hypothetical protein